jgi:hypothetical protein
MAFLASEDLYRVVRDMQLRNQIIPVVADFAGPTGIRAVGDFLKQRNLTAQAFYLSNVEQYLFQNGVAAEFYQNVATLPLDSTSTFIRSIPPNYIGGAGMPFAIGRINGNASVRIMINGGMTSAIATYDSAGYRWMQTTQDSGGVAITRVYRDSVGVLTLMRTDSAKSNQSPSYSSVPMPNVGVPNGGIVMPVAPGRVAGNSFVVGGGLLNSGIASMKKTIDAFNTGGASTYRDIIAMTKLDGWK